MPITKCLELNLRHITQDDVKALEHAAEQRPNLTWTGPGVISYEYGFIVFVSHHPDNIKRDDQAMAKLGLSSFYNDVIAAARAANAGVVLFDTMSETHEGLRLAQEEP